MPGGSERPRIALICPTNWDRLQLPRIRARVDRRYDLLPYGPDAESDPATFDADIFIEQAAQDLSRAQLDGVVSTSDYPGCLVSAIVARRLNLPGPDPESLLRASHKYYSRQIQLVAVPEATPKFALFQPEGLRAEQFDFSFPLFVKPVKSLFSQYSRRVDSFAELEDFATSEGVRSHLTDFVQPFNQLLHHYEEFGHDGGWMLVEEVLEGRQLTLEGYVVDGSITVIGIVDTVFYPGSPSFQRFEYPSSVDAAGASRMSDIAGRLVLALGLTYTLFNIEFIYNERSGSVHVVEINPRICAQFADIMESVNGVNTYEPLFEIALGRKPIVRAEADFEVAASFALRSFADGQMVSTPSSTTVRWLQSHASVSFVSLYYGEGERLSDNPKQFDGWSYRYAVVNLRADNWQQLFASFAWVTQTLAIRIDGERPNSSNLEAGRARGPPPARRTTSA